MEGDPITCHEVVELVTDYLEGRLAPVDRLRFEQHLDGCPHCVVYLQQMRETITSLGRVREDDLDPATRDELLAVFREWRAEGTSTS